jgi:hypothetical protein
MPRTGQDRHFDCAGPCALVSKPELYSGSKGGAAPLYSAGWAQNRKASAAGLTGMCSLPDNTPLAIQNIPETAQSGQLESSL